MVFPENSLIFNDSLANRYFKNMRTSILLLWSVFLGISIYSQEKTAEPSPIIYIYDASGSMWGQMQGKTKMEIASEVLSSSVKKLPDNQNIGFVAYGHRQKSDCEDVEFLVDVKDGTKNQVIESIKKIKPLGKTPLAYSALQVIDKLRQTGLKATIILVTDGIESCGGDICEVIKAAKKEGIDFRLHIIGFGLKETETEQLKCAANAGDGNYYDAANAEGLGEVLAEATATTVDLPDGNMTIYAIKNGVPIDAYIQAYDIKAKRNPISSRTYRDTAIFYLPPSTYNLEVTPLQGSDVEKITLSNIESYEEQMVHRTVSFDAGELSIKTTNNGENWDCLVKLFHLDGSLAAQERTYTASKKVEVNPGTYNVTIKALGKLEGILTSTKMENVEITAGQITPISYDFESGHFEIYPKVGDELIDTVVTITEESSSTNVARSRTYTKGAKFLLNPGKYQVNVKPLGAHKAKSAQTLYVQVTKGEITSNEVSF